MWALIILLIALGVIAALTEVFSKNTTENKNTSNCDTCGEVNCQMKGIMERKKHCTNEIK